MAEPRIFASLDPFFEGGALMGRRVANAGLLDALFRADPFDEYHFFLATNRIRGEFEAVLEAGHAALARSGRVRVFSRQELPRRLSGTEYYCFHLSDCINHPAALARLRNLHSPEIFPVTGPIHSLSRTVYPRDFLAHLWAGTTRRDCVVCTSRPGREAVGNFYAALRRGFGLDQAEYPQPQLAHIPLGVDVDALCVPGEAEREAARAHFRLGTGEVALLAFGRVEHHSKMDVLPLLRAAQRLFALGIKQESVRLFIAGWAGRDESFSATLGELAANIGLKTTIMLRPDEEEKRRLFVAADVFVSIADNPQETFGLTILEAGACGLPVVASEYDGYRDLVVPESTGVLVPTIGPAATRGVNALSGLLFDNQYHLLVSQQTVVEVGPLAESLARLVRDPGLRERMGRAGRRRVEEKYSWEAVVSAHLELWDELWREAVGDRERLRNARHPLELDFAATFSPYPAAGLDDAMRLVATRLGDAVYRRRDHPLIYSGIGEMVTADDVSPLVFLARKPLAVGELKEKLCTANPGLDRERADFLILWGLKHDLLERLE